MLKINILNPKTEVCHATPENQTFETQNWRWMVQMIFIDFPFPKRWLSGSFCLSFSCVTFHRQELPLKDVAYPYEEVNFSQHLGRSSQRFGCFAVVVEKSQSSLGSLHSIFSQILVPEFLWQILDVFFLNSRNGEGLRFLLFLCQRSFF